MNIAINKIKGNPNNPRLIKNDKFRLLVTSIQETPEMMTLRPVIIDEDNIILGGNMRWKACKELGWKEVPTKPYTRDEHKASESFTKYGKTYEKVCEEILIKDNTHYGEFDMDILANTYDPADLGAYGVDVWQPDEVSEGLTDEDDVPEAPEEPITKLGDVWLLGEHRVMCGDSTSKEAVDVLMDGEKPNALVTDPPYGINANKQTLGTGKKKFHRGGNWDSERPDITHLLNYDQVLIWGGNYFSDILEPTNNWLCWHKKNDGLSFSEFELAWTNLGKNCRLLSHHWGGNQRCIPR